MYHTRRGTALLTAWMLLTLCGCGTIPIEPGLIGEQTVPPTAEQTVMNPVTETTAAESLSAEDADTETTQTSLTQQSGTTPSNQTVFGTRQTAESTGTSAAHTTTADTAYDDLQEIVNGMTLREKAAQMMLVSCSDAASAQKAAAEGAGGLCLFAAPFKGKTKEQVQSMIEDFQSSAVIPLIVSADEEGGTINRISLNTQLRSSPFRSSSALFAEGGWELVRSDTKEKAELLFSLGVNVNLAPVCDVPIDKSNYIYSRCFSTDAAETAEYIRVVVTEMKADGLGSVLKHFPGYGGSADTHKNMAYDERDYTAFENGDFLPFSAGIAAGADAVMVSHNIVTCMDSAYPASLSSAVHRILREELGFTGVIISDDLGMNAIIQFTDGNNPAVAAVQAGNDLLTYADFTNSVDALTAAVEEGIIPESQIDASVLRILEWKRSLGLL